MFSSDLNVGPDVIDIISLNPAITSLSIESLQPETVQAIVGTTNIKSLTLECDLTEDDVIALSTNTTITHLNLSNCDELDGGRFATNTTIIKLNLNNITGRHLDVEGAKRLAKNNTIKILKLFHNLIRDEGATAMAQNTTITKLNLGANGIENDGATALFTLNSTIKTLKLHNNKIGDQALQRLAMNATITDINLEHNTIRKASAMALAQNTTIKYLTVQTDMKGLKKVFQNTTITSLKAAGPTIPFEDKSMWRAMTQNTTITRLDLHAHVSATGWDVLTSHATISKLSLTEPISATQVAQLACTMNISKLQVKCWRLDDAAVNALALNTTITALSLAMSDNYNYGWVKGLNTLAHNTTITKLTTHICDASQGVQDQVKKNRKRQKVQQRTVLFMLWAVFKVRLQLFHHHQNPPPKANNTM